MIASTLESLIKECAEMLKRSLFIYCFSVSIILLIAIFVFPKCLLAQKIENWFYGAAGYEKALNLSMNDELPLIVYFKTDWCGWCKKMDRDYITSLELKRSLTNILKVEINPDNGKVEKSIAKIYGCTGYPSFFVSVPSFDVEAERLHPFMKQKDLTTSEFVNVIKKKIAKLYSDKGYASYEMDAYAEAHRYLDMAEDYYLDNYYVYYLKGFIDFNIGYKAKDISILKRAEGYYLKALEIDPDHQASKQELEQLNKTIEFISKDTVNYEKTAGSKVTEKEDVDNKVNEFANLNTDKREYSQSHYSTQNEKYNEAPPEDSVYAGPGNTVVRDKQKELLAYKKAIPHLLQGYDYFGNGNYEKAKDEFEKAIEIKPNYSSAHNALSDVCKKLGLYENAKEEKDLAIYWAEY